MAKEIEKRSGYTFNAKIATNGMILVPSWVRTMIERGAGDEIEVLVPVKQE